uniref:Uncharacterized protein n=1 Tax=Lepeophtheirus salmonis TaxID=72036 RepID=A0A0K2UA73_LEPSM
MYCIYICIMYDWEDSWFHINCYFVQFFSNFLTCIPTKPSPLSDRHLHSPYWVKHIFSFFYCQDT